MKRYIFIIHLLFIWGYINAQSRPPADTRSSASSHSHLKNELVSDTSSLERSQIYAWKIDPRLGERIPTLRDSSVVNFHQSSLTDGKDVAVSYLGNIGLPAESKIFFDRPEASLFAPLDTYRYWHKNPEDQLFLNTKVPYSNLYYQSGGGGNTKEERFMAEISSNFGKNFNLGLNVDYLYARGFYTNLYNKQINYDVYASYIGDKYKMHAFIANNNYKSSENGGIQDDRYITDPNSMTGSDGSSLGIPVNISSDTWNKLRGKHIYVTNRYDLGNDEETYQINDSTTGVRKKKDYVSLASIIYTFNYTDQRRQFTSNNANLDTLFTPYTNGVIQSSPKYSASTDDFMSYYSLKNTFGLAMNEGFREWTKFGLTAFIEYDLRNYSIQNAIFPMFQDTDNKENIYTIGGLLSKNKGKFLHYNLLATKNLSDAGLRIEGDLSTRFNYKQKDFIISANAYIKNVRPSFFEQNYSSKYLNWNYNLDYTQRVFAGGSIEIPFTHTKLSGGVENIKKYIYYDQNGLIQQEKDNVQVLSFRLDQKLQAGIFHWDNQIVFQTTTKEEVIPLPKLSFYTNIYIKTKLAKVLTLQLGADAHFYSKYYAPAYSPLTLQFYNQREKQIGDFPITTAYLNLHLKYTRFFIMYYNATSKVGNSEYFSLLHYPVNPSMIKFGISWDFFN